MKLGRYDTPHFAAEDLGGGHTFSLTGIHTTELGMPREIGEWENV